MINGVHNWNYRDVVSVLKEHHFTLQHIRGSHHYYVGTVNGKLHQVCVPKHGSEAFKPRTMRGIMLQSGLGKEMWKV